MANILLVEDNELNQDMLKRRLERKGHVVTIAADGELGVKLALERLPDLILMDISLPQIDGWEATRRIKGDPLTAKIPIMALTAHALSTDRERCIQAGCDDYDTKPVDFPRLMGKIDALLAGEAS
jgi:two-component system cell cycle response regulator DivK